MKEIELIEEVLQGWPDWAAWKVRGWALKREGFRVFFRDNAAKIRHKFRTAEDEGDKGDVLAELEFASCVGADQRFSLHYEPCDSADGRNPDFLVKAEGLQDFYLEVKRVRETAGTHQIQRFRHAIIEAARGIPSSLGISVDVFSDSPIELGPRLCNVTSAVVAQCTQAIHDCEKSLLPDEDLTVPVEGFEEEVSITLSKVRGKASTSPTANFGGAYAVSYTQKEFRKFGDHVLDCLGQMRHGTANVLAVKIDSTPHDPEDLIRALRELGKQVIDGREEFFRSKGFAGSRDFCDLFPVLSAVVVKSIWSSDGGIVPCNLVWVNPRAAVRLEDGVVEHLRSM